MERGKDLRSVNRVKLTQPLKVVMGSIGNNIRYDLATRNISPSGFFLDFEKPGRFPFNPASIMEVWLELEVGNTIFFNGKMARVVFPDNPLVEETGPGIAIRIVQIDPKNESALLDFIYRNLEAKKDENGVA